MASVKDNFPILILTHDSARRLDAQSAAGAKTDDDVATNRHTRTLVDLTLRS